MTRTAWGILLVLLVGLGEQVFGLDQIRGQITDKAGKPIAEVWASAYPLAAGQLRYAIAAKGETNAEGWLDLTMPFEGVRYKLWISKTGYADTSVSAVAGDGRPIEVKLGSAPLQTLRGSVLSSVTGNPAAGAMVILIPGYGRRETVTGEAGQFEFTGLPGSFGRAGVIYAEQANLISSLQTTDTGTALALGSPAGLEGNVCERDSGEPVADSRVILRTVYMSGFSRETRTDKDGRYRFDHVPPGPYEVVAFHDEWWHTLAWWKSELPLRAGQVGFWGIALDPRVPVKGTVLGRDGKPVAQAVVAMPIVGEWLGASEERITQTRTDDQGRFLLRTGLINETTTIEAFHPMGGIGRAEVSVDREHPKEVAIKLGGTMRVRGKVTDSDGRPIKDVEVSTGLGPHGNVKTDAAGRFDFGWVPLAVPEGDDQTITFRAPRPASFCDPRFAFGEFGDQHPFDNPRKRTEGPAMDATFFHHKHVTAKAAPGEEIDLNVTAEPASVITFAGRVLDHEGAPVTDARLILFAGNANPKTWKDDLYPMRRMLNSMAPSPEEINTPIARTTAGGRGEWSVQVVKETAESTQLSTAAGGAIDVSRYSLGAESPSGASILIPDIVLSDGQTEKRIDVKLPAPGNAIRAVVVDTQGNPLAGIDVRTSFPGQSLTTDAQGRLLLEREHRDKFNLWVTSPGWSILSPSPDEQGPRIALDSRQQSGHEVIIVLAKPGRLTVTARWSTGGSVTEYELLDHHTWVADPRGAFTFDEFPAGQHTIRVQSAEGVMGSAAVDLEPGGQAAVEIVLPRPEYALAGRVIDSAGSPFHGSKVSVKISAFEAATLPDEHGRFALKVPPGSYKVSAHSLADRFDKVIGEADVTVGPRFADQAGPDVFGYAPPEAEVLITVNQASNRTSR